LQKYAKICKHQVEFKQHFYDEFLTQLYGKVRFTYQQHWEFVSDQS